MSRVTDKEWNEYCDVFHKTVEGISRPALDSLLAERDTANMIIMIRELIDFAEREPELWEMLKIENSQLVDKLQTMLASSLRNRKIS
jgi:hypothetical protein